MGDYYVYTHSDKNGNVFYVGKGIGRRAFQKERHPMWEIYVQRLNGNYNVKIVKDNLDEYEAELFETEKQIEYGGNLINWINPGRKVNMEVLDKYWNERKANEKRLQENKRLEKENIETAIIIYKEILTKLYEYERYDLSEAECYSGLAKQVYKEFYFTNSKFKNGNLEILNRYTLCLKKVLQFDVAAEAIKEYIKVFPASLNTSAFQPILKRSKIKIELSQ